MTNEEKIRALRVALTQMVLDFGVHGPELESFMLSQEQARALSIARLTLKAVGNEA